MLCNMSVTWVAARDRCVQAGMTLVRVDDAAENTFIRTHVDPLANPQVWLGANDVELEGTWRWLDEPDDRQAVEDCAESFPQGMWGDQPCNDAAALDVVFCEQL